ncbi:hypothetical protein JOD43_000631 [Pullulanibacillus pueri]|uniref:Spore germination protein n=1 Tax=Pullulanibacillus pueri TaxID=1437324 RepID=A0A8J2ZZE6_9BACL|nr:hypothetical protein [Pullulanibacillus pueri]MBM7680469.1 hypothetical protein [Pullulanibacillus pueri]GGH88160.1 hypothetical protein GCM10007096_39860 [Pullulanibacillus pueri]
MAVNINFAAINVNAINRDSSVSIGENNQPGWSSHSKNNYGDGLLFGINLINQMNNIMDNDVIDAPINDQDGIPGNQNQTL